MNDLEYIKEQFEKDGIKAPETLSESAIFDKLEEAPAPEPPKKNKSHKRAIQGILAAAACAVIVFAAPSIRDTILGVPDTEPVDGRLRTYESYGELERLLKDLQPEATPFLMGNAKDAAVEETADAVAATGAAAAGAGESHSDTYKQVEGVDEADIIKTDGKYIYHVTGEGEIRISEASNGKVKKLSMISQFDDDAWIDNIYLDGDRLIAVSQMFDDCITKTVITVYDISDRSNPKHIESFQQSGHVIDTRMSGGYIYLVTNDYVDADNRCVPYVGTTGSFKKMPIGDICVFPHPNQPSYIVVSSIDVKSGKKLKSQSRAILGASEQIYCNTENLYVASTSFQGTSGHMVTQLLKIQLNKGKLKITATGKVRGYVNDQFSMDERDGYFRIATTSDRNGKDVNNLYVLDEKLKKVGEVTGFARNEHIEAVRYIGTRAYVITYEQTDPLFIIDLTDPKDPKMEGSVKISGFSTLLVPSGKDELLGIGFATEENEFGEATDGVKLALFDISNPAKPKVKDAKAFKGYDSEAQYNHHALLEGLTDGGWAIPYTCWNEEYDDETGDLISEEYYGGVIAFKTKNGKIKLTKNYKVKDEGVRRCIRIGDYIYALDENDAFHSFPLK